MSAKLKYSHVKHIGYNPADSQEIAVTLTFHTDGPVTPNEIIDHITEKLKDGIEVNENTFCDNYDKSGNRCEIQCNGCEVIGEPKAEINDMQGLGFCAKFEYEGDRCNGQCNFCETLESKEPAKDFYCNHGGLEVLKCNVQCLACNLSSK